jgi:hypothetical protein
VAHSFKNLNGNFHSKNSRLLLRSELERFGLFLKTLKTQNSPLKTHHFKNVSLTATFHQQWAATLAVPSTRFFLSELRFLGFKDYRIFKNATSNRRDAMHRVSTPDVAKKQISLPATSVSTSFKNNFKTIISAKAGISLQQWLQSKTLLKTFAFKYPPPFKKTRSSTKSFKPTFDMRFPFSRE